MTLLCEPDPAMAAALAPLYGDASVVPSLPEAALAVAALGAQAKDPQNNVIVGPGVPIDEVLTFAVRINAATQGAAIILLRDQMDDALPDIARHAGISEVHAMQETAELRDASQSARDSRRGKKVKHLTLVEAPSTGE